MLWTIFVSTVTKPENPLPRAIRQNVANLGIFVMKHTIAILAEPKPEKISTLIDINRNLAAGLPPAPPNPRPRKISDLSSIDRSRVLKTGVGVSL